MSGERKEMSSTEMKGLAWKVLPWIMDLVAALLTAWAVQVNQQLGKMQADVQALKEWKAETSGNRYTVKDHVTFAESNAKELQQLWMKIAEMQQTWLRDMGDIKIALAQLPTKADIQTIDTRLRDHEQKQSALK